MVKGLLLALISVLLSQSIFAKNVESSPLFANDEIYEMVRVLHSARYDYDQGVGILLRKRSVVENPYYKESVLKECHQANPQEIVERMKDAVSHYKSFFYDEAFSFDKALDLLDEKVSSESDLSRCIDEKGVINYYSNGNQFLISYKY